MINIITANSQDVRSIRDYNDNFIISHLIETTNPPFNTNVICYHFDVYYQDGISLADYTDYTDTPEITYRFIPVASITEALDRIAVKLIDAEDEAAERAEDDEDTQEDLLVAVVCNVKWNYQVVRYLNGRINESGNDTSCLDLYRHFKIVRQERLVDILKEHLHTQFIYPEDPLAYGYALFQLISGVLQ